MSARILKREHRHFRDTIAPLSLKAFVRLSATKYWRAPLGREALAWTARKCSACGRRLAREVAEVIAEEQRVERRCFGEVPDGR